MLMHLCHDISDVRVPARLGSEARRELGLGTPICVIESKVNRRKTHIRQKEENEWIGAIIVTCLSEGLSTGDNYYAQFGRSRSSSNLQKVSVVRLRHAHVGVIEA